jgi:predicted DNA binding CopG/RHH family protein
MNASDKTTTAAEEWETGKFGQDEAHVKKSDASSEKDLDKALGLKLISIRLPKELIDDLKLVAKLNGIGYQPLIRQLLKRFVIAEKKRALLDALSDVKSKEKIAARESARIAKEKKAA